MPNTPENRLVPLVGAGPNLDMFGGLLDAMRLRCSVLANFLLMAPWGLDCGAETSGCPFHLVLAGECWLLRPGFEPLHLMSGDLAALPHWGGHILASSPDAPVTGIGEALAVSGGDYWRPDSSASAAVQLVWGGDGPETRILSGVVVLEPGRGRTILDELPDLIHIPQSGAEMRPLLDGIVDIVREETREDRLGRSAIISRLSELLFIQTIRSHLLLQPPQRPGVVKGWNDQRVGPALRAIHLDPQRRWTAPQLASIAGLSRAAFAKRFTDTVGVSPLAYVQRWRMHLAADLLASGERSCTRIAELCGYDSVVAFAKRFKAFSGQTPTQYRREVNTGLA